ncbi:hypothetical protein ACHAWF_008999 [Thalassiosira exigua]
MKAAPPLSRLPNIYLGTMTFSWKAQTSSHVTGELGRVVHAGRLRRLPRQVRPGTVRVDTARVYAGGDSERMIGRALASLGDPSPIVLGTKAHPSHPDGLSSKGIRAQLQSSLEAMGVSAVNEFYLHQPDEEHSLLDSLKTLHELVEEGTVSAVGMSNYHASEVQRAFDLCDRHGLTKPREVKEGRFKNNQNYLPRFYTPANFRALEVVHAACEAAGISMVEASYRWLLRHSALRAGGDGESGDRILISASFMNQLEEKLRCCARAGDGQEGNLTLRICQGGSRWILGHPTMQPNPSSCVASRQISRVKLLLYDTDLPNSEYWHLR